MNQVTRILHAIERGDPQAADSLLPLVYDELRKLASQRLANEKPGQTLQATALVHEAYLRLVDTERTQDWNGRAHFFGAAAEAMRQILMNRARDKKRLKRGGGWKRVSLDQLARADDASDDDLIAVDEVLARLAEHDQTCADLVKLRFFAGLTLEEAAASLGLGRRTADRHWAYARAWMYNALSEGEAPAKEANP
jgi:RNA polymerase sigma factor (TIGR02999 family)